MHGFFAMGAYNWKGVLLLQDLKCKLAPMRLHSFSNFSFLSS